MTQLEFSSLSSTIQNKLRVNANIKSEGFNCLLLRRLSDCMFAVIVPFHWKLHLSVTLNAYDDGDVDEREGRRLHLLDFH